MTWTDIWGSGPDDVFFVSLEGVILHFDGCTFQQMRSPKNVELNGVWGSGRRDVLAVGRKGTVLRFDGTRWQKMAVPAHQDLNAVWGSGPRDVFAVGSKGTVLHFDGARWRKMAVPTRQNLNDVWGSDPQNVFVVGDNRTVLHFDGTQWTRQTMPGLRCGPNTNCDLSAVWGSGPKNVFVARRVQIEIPYFFRFDGSKWTPLGKDMLCGRLCDIEDMHGMGSPTKFIAVGSHGVILTSDGRTVSGGDKSTFATPWYHAVWMVGQKDYWVVDESGGIFRNQGRGLERVCLSGLPLLAIGGSGPSNVYAVGAEGFALHYNGRRWSVLFEPEDSESTLQSIWSCGPDCVFLGSAVYASIDWYDGHCWHSKQLGGRGDEIVDIWGTSASNVYAVVSDHLVHFDGKSWQRESGPRFDVMRIWPLDAPRQAAAWSKTQGLLVYEAQHGTWRPVAGLPRGVKPLHVWGRDSGNLTVVGTHGGIWRYRNSKWRRIVSPGSHSYDHAWTDRRGRLYVVRPGAAPLLFNGRRWVTLSGRRRAAALSEWHRPTNPLIPFAITSRGGLVQFRGGRWHRVALDRMPHLKPRMCSQDDDDDE